METSCSRDARCGWSGTRSHEDRLDEELADLAAVGGVAWRASCGISVACLGISRNVTSVSLELKKFASH